MRNWIRRTRGVFGAGALWGAAGTAAGAAVGLVTGLAIPAIPVGLAIANGSAALGLLGVTAGTSFATALSVADGKKSIRELSPGKWATVGGVLGALYSAALFVVAGPPTELLLLAPTAFVFGAIAASISGASVLAARRDAELRPSTAAQRLLPSDT